MNPPTVVGQYKGQYTAGNTSQEILPRRHFFGSGNQIFVDSFDSFIALLLLRMAAETPLLFRLLIWSIMSLMMRDTRGETINKNNTFVNKRSLGPT